MATEERHLPEGGPTLAETYERYAPALRQIIGKSASAADVEDILHNTFLRLARQYHQGRVDLSRPLWPLLLTLARRARIDHWRAQPRDVASGSLPRARRNDVDLPGEELEVVESISDALASLRPRDKRLLVRCVVEEAPRAVVAADEVLSEGALNVAVSRARKRFRAAYRAASDERGALGAWPFVVRLRVRLSRVAARAEREDILRLGVGATAAAAATVVTLAVAAAAPPPEISGTVNASDAPADYSEAPADQSRVLHHAPLAGADEPSIGRPLTGRTGDTDRASSPRSAVEVRRLEGTLEAEPRNPSVGFYVAWDDPLGSGHFSAGAEFVCSGGRVATTACPVLRQIPGTTSDTQP